MDKGQHTPHNEPIMASEPMRAYRIQKDYRPANIRASKEQRIQACTMTVDEYFDKLISLVYDDYANV